MNITLNKELIKQLWKNGFFKIEDLKFNQSSSFEIVSRGVEIENSAADFSGAVIRDTATGQEIRGGVRIDGKSSDWRSEGTLLDPKYEGIILHVVANYDTPLLRNGLEILSCQLTPKPWIIDYYSRISLECETRFATMSSLDRSELLSQLLDDRIKRKTGEILNILDSVNGDWYECCYIALFRALGGKNNKGEFEKMARSTSYTFLSLHQKRQELVIATLLGQAGYLDFESKDPSVDEYTRSLQREFLASKSSDGVIPTMFTWQPQRLRPSSAPAISLVRIAVLLSSQPELFDLIIELDNLDDLRQHLTVEMPKYWVSHSAPSKGINGRAKSFGGSRVDILILNFVIPILYTRSILDNNEEFATRAYHFYESINAEHYTKISKWYSKDWRASTSFDSQALIQLVDENCRSIGCVGCPLAAKELLRIWRVNM